jgi:hypothetical protein
MKRLFAFAVLILAFALPAGAANLTGSFTLPTTYVDGTPLALADIRHIHIETGTCTSAGVFAVREAEVDVAPPATTYALVSPRSWGNFCVRARTVTQLGSLSVYVGVSVIKQEPNPSPPTLATPTVAAVFELIPDRWDGVRLGRNVGWVDAGTLCKDNAPLEGWYEVADNNDVNYSKTNPKSAVLVTQCKWQS